VNFGAGSPVIIAIHAAHFHQVAVYTCTLLSIVFAVTLVRFAAAFVPGSEPVGVPSQRHQASSPARAAVACPPGQEPPRANARRAAPARHGMGSPRRGVQ